MNRVIYFSQTMNTKQIAEYCSNYLNIPIVNLSSYSKINSFDYSVEFDNIVFCMPIYSQNVHRIVFDIIKKIKANNFIIIATYGKMATGNAIYEIKNKLNINLIGAAYLPTKHSYKDNLGFSDFEKLNPLLDKLKLKDFRPVEIKKRRKNIFSNLLPNIRSRIGVKISKTNSCINCNNCTSICPTNSIRNGNIKNKTCIRCLGCYYNCIESGLSVKYSIFLKWYLKKDKINKVIIYL